MRPTGGTQHDTAGETGHTRTKGRCARVWLGPARPHVREPSRTAHGLTHVCARPYGHPPPCMCACADRPDSPA